MLFSGRLDAFLYDLNPFSPLKLKEKKEREREREREREV